MKKKTICILKDKKFKKIQNKTFTYIHARETQESEQQPTAVNNTFFRWKNKFRMEAKRILQCHRIVRVVFSVKFETEARVKFHARISKHYP